MTKCAVGELTVSITTAAQDCWLDWAFVLLLEVDAVGPDSFISLLQKKL